MRRLAVLLVATAVAAGCGGGRKGSLSFTRSDGNDASVWIARADGSHARRLIPHAVGGLLSADGRLVAYGRPARALAMNLVVSPVAGGEARKLGPVLSYEWSPEGERLVFTTKTTLQVTDFATGAGRILARRGDVEGFGFAPGGGSYVFDSWRGKERSLRSDIYAVGLKGKVRRLTHDGHSGQPVWGRNWIAYRRFHTERGSRWPVSDIWLMRPDGTGKRQLAGVSPTAPSGVFFGHRQLAVIGLMPLRFSADDKHLLACDASGLLCQAVTIAVPDGTLHKLRVPGTYAQAWGLSGDGRDVLVQASRSFDARDASVYSIPVDGGAPRLLVPDAAQPSWALR